MAAWLTVVAALATALLAAATPASAAPASAAPPTWTPPAPAASVVPPSAPRTLGTGIIRETSVELVWSPALPGSNRIAGYDVFAALANPPGMPARLVATTTLAGGFFTVGGLVPGTAFRFFVRARDTAGVSGPPSPSVTVTTAVAGTSPGPPVAVAATATATTVTLAWTPPTTHAAQVTGYDVITPAPTPTAPIRLWARVSGQATSVTVTGLSPATTYRAVVVAHFSDGTPAATSALGSFTTTASAPVG
jgi:chitodextrinase